MGMTNEEREKEIRKQPIPTKEECLAFYKELVKLEDVRFVPYYKMVIEVLEQQPCEDYISREAVDNYIVKLMSSYLYDEERTRLEDLTAYIWELPSVTPQPSEDWYDVPSDEMTLEQARQAVKNLRKKLAEHLEQQPNRCDSCVHSEEQDGSNCYECVKGMTDNFETQPMDADCISRQAVLDYIEGSGAELGHSSENELVCQDIKKLPSVTPKTESKEGD